jgi:hypothetical protein
LERSALHGVLSEKFITTAGYQTAGPSTSLRFAQDDSTFEIRMTAHLK